MPFPTKPKKHRELGGALERFLGNLSFITTVLQITKRELDRSRKLSAINYSSIEKRYSEISSLFIHELVL